LAEPAAVPSNIAVPQKRSIATWVALVVVTLSLSSLAFVHFREIAAMAPMIATSMNAPEGIATDFTSGRIGTPELSPDGQWIVFGASTPAIGPRSGYAHSMKCGGRFPLASIDDDFR
jgi:hypothetical protein